MLMCLIICTSTGSFANEPNQTNTEEYYVFNLNYGSFVKTENIKVREFPAETYEKAKKALKDLGVSDYWATETIKKISGMEDDNIGKRVADELPGSLIYGDADSNALAGDGRCQPARRLPERRNQAVHR